MSERAKRGRGHLDEIVSTEVRVLLVRRGMTNGDLAALIGWDKTSVSRRLRGDTAWSLADLERVCRALDVSPRDLLPTDETVRESR